MNIRALRDRILVKRAQVKERSFDKIIIPDTAKEKPMEGKVIAVGKGRILKDGKIWGVDVKKGDRILISKYAGTEVKIGEEEYLIMREDDVLGVIQD